MRVRYPRTTHLPWSPGASSDDVRADDLAGLEGQEVVVTEKLDGENTTLYRDGLHARSPDSAHHPSRAWLKALHARIAHRIPEGFRVCGENVFARHSLAYDALEGWFYAFSVWDEHNHCLDWDATVRFTRELGVPVPPVLFRGRMDERRLRRLKLDLARQEGYVVRTVAGFPAEAFARRVAKWVRPGHVQTDTHWMLAPVVPNGLGPRACLWEVRAGARPDVPALRAALGLDTDVTDEAAALDAATRLAILGRTGDTLLAGVLAALLHAVPRAPLMARLPAQVGMRTARVVGDLVGLHGRLHRELPDALRPAGLRRMARAVDLGTLHAVALAALAGQDDETAHHAREQVALSELFAADAGALDGRELAAIREGLRAALANHAPEARDRCFGEAARAWAEGRLRSPEEAVAATWRFREGERPTLTVMVGPSGSGKSTFVEGAAGAAAIVSLDALRAARGDRGEQSENAEVLHEALARLTAHLAAGRPVVWDATSLTAAQRALSAGRGERYDALVTFAVMLVPESVLRSRNARRAHPVPDDVLSAQLARFNPPYPGDAHRTLYLDETGLIADRDGLDEFAR